MIKYENVKHFEEMKFLIKWDTTFLMENIF
jgi:hypothetical protein